MTFNEGRLTLAYRNIDELPKDVVNKYKNKVEILDVSHNQIRDVRFLQWFPNITSVILDSNEISGSTVFPYVENLQLLWLNKNKIQCLFPLVENISKNFPKLKHLSLMGNVVVPSSNEECYYEYVRYRYYVISWLPGLEFLDDRPITEDEKEEAFLLFKRPFLDNFPMLSKFLDSSFLAIKGLFSTSQQQPRAHFI